MLCAGGSMATASAKCTMPPSTWCWGNTTSSSWVVDPEARSVEAAAHNGHELATVQVYPRGTSLETPFLPGLALHIDGLFREE